ncbi:hypothetical protein EDF70_10979 [Neorhizobium sp. JUb45]|nr:hypothetical protein EDF70_10979 [Neorhizobium sp. JUb45]
MRGHSVLRDIEQPGKFACWDAIWFVTHEQTKRLKAGVLSQGRKGGNCVVIFHISRLMDVL